MSYPLLKGHSLSIGLLQVSKPHKRLTKDKRLQEWELLKAFAREVGHGEIARVQVRHEGELDGLATDGGKVQLGAPDGGRDAEPRLLGNHWRGHQLPVVP